MLPLFVKIAYVSGHGNVWTVRNMVPIKVKRGRKTFDVTREGRSLLIA